MGEKVKKNTDKINGSQKPLPSHTPVSAIQNTVGQYNIVFDNPTNTAKKKEKQPEKNISTK